MLALRMCFLAFIYLMNSAYAVELEYAFTTPRQQQEFKELTTQLRCLVCQNQNLADSNAPLAKDLRQEIYQMLSQGQSKQEIRDFLVQRYGDFVLYKPPLQGNTVLLWLAPLVFLGIGLVVVLRLFTKATALSPLTAEQRAAVQQSLADLKTNKQHESSSC